MRPTILILMCVTILFSCRKEKKHTYNTQSLDLTVTKTVDGNNSFDWTEVNTDDFISYELIGSNSPIPAFSADGSLNAPIIFSSKNRKNSSFKDSTGNTINLKYYRLVARLERSVLTSTDVVDTSISFIPIENISNNNLFLFPIPENENIIVIKSGSSNVSILLIDYNSQEIINEISTINSVTNRTHLGYYQNKKVLYSYTESKITIYDIVDLSVIATHTINLVNSNNLFGLFLKNDYFLCRDYINNSFQYLSINITNGVTDTFDQNSISSSQFIYRPVNPTFFGFVVNSIDTITYYDIDANGKMTFDRSQYYNQNILGTHAIPNSDLEQIVTASGVVYDKDLSIIKTFNTSAPNSAGSKFWDCSHDSKYYAFAAAQNFNQPILEIFRDWQIEPIKSLAMTNSHLIRSIFIEDKSVVIVTTGSIDGKEGIILNKRKIDE